MAAHAREISKTSPVKLNARPWPAGPTRWRACPPPPPPYPAGAAPWGGAHAPPRDQQRSKGIRLPRSRKRGRSPLRIEAWRPTPATVTPPPAIGSRGQNFSPRPPRVGKRVGARHFDARPWDTQRWAHFRAVSREWGAWSVAVTAGLKEVGRPSIGPPLDASDENGAPGRLRRVGPRGGGSD